MPRSCHYFTKLVKVDRTRAIIIHLKYIRFPNITGIIVGLTSEMMPSSSSSVMVASISLKISLNLSTDM